MATAKIERELAANGQGCLGKAKDDEPVFILRGQDLLSDRLVDKWADRAEASGCSPEKVQEARNLAKAMRNYWNRKLPD